MTRAVDGRSKFYCEVPKVVDNAKATPTATAEREQTPAINTLARDIETKQKRLENAKRKLADKSFVEEEARKIVEAEIKDLTQKILEDEKQLRIMKARLALGMAEEFLTKAEKEKKGNIKDLQEKVEAKRKKLSEAEQSVIIG